MRNPPFCPRGDFSSYLLLRIRKKLLQIELQTTIPPPAPPRVPSIASPLTTTSLHSSLLFWRSNRPATDAEREGDAKENREGRLAAVSIPRPYILKIGCCTWV
ncbi:hypothetical protein Taro_035879 [Colocasia esculenta]|uniref:Uncharacterized protein n=1 Tax=Colocasia esculenta TaxID=4460 RepID=A0A843WEL0_COLES|nr:hypothetical protein [Colocasia esculenta]